MEFIQCKRKADGKNFTALEICTILEIWYVISEWDVMEVFSKDSFDELFEREEEK